VEKELRRRLLQTSSHERPLVFQQVYAELFERIPWHPAIAEVRSGPDHTVVRKKGRAWPALIGSPPRSVLEIGSGAGELLIALAEEGYRCVGIDVEPSRVEALRRYGGGLFEVVHGDGTFPAFPDGSFDIVISQQVCEHLHPDDALAHLAAVRRILRKGGSYFLETPNPLVGPHDVSRFFVRVGRSAEGLHLREYPVREMTTMFRHAGFSKVDVILWRSRRVGERKAEFLERIWKYLPPRVRIRHTMGLHNPVYCGKRLT